MRNDNALIHLCTCAPVFFSDCLIPRHAEGARLYLSRYQARRARAPTCRIEVHACLSWRRDINFAARSRAVAADRWIDRRDNFSIELPGLENSFVWATFCLYFMAVISNAFMYFFYFRTTEVCTVISTFALWDPVLPKNCSNPSLLERKDQRWVRAHWHGEDSERYIKILRVVMLLRFCSRSPADKETFSVDVIAPFVFSHSHHTNYFPSRHSNKIMYHVRLASQYFCVAEEIYLSRTSDTISDIPISQVRVHWIPRHK